MSDPREPKDEVEQGQPPEAGEAGKPYAELRGLNAAARSEAAAHDHGPADEPVPAAASSAGAADPEAAAEAPREEPRRAAPPPESGGRRGGIGAVTAVLLALVAGTLGALLLAPLVASRAPEPVAEYFTDPSDERLAALESRLAESEATGASGAAASEDLRAALADLQQAMAAMEGRIAALEENGGGGSAAEVAALRDRIAALEAAPAEDVGSQDIAELARRIEALEGGGAVSGPGVEGLGQRIAELEASRAVSPEALDALAERIAALETDGSAAGARGIEALSQRLADLEQSLPPIGESDLAELGARIASLESRSPEVARDDLEAIDARVGEIQAELEAARQRAAEAETALAETEQQTAERERRTRLETSAAALESQLRAGVPFTAILQNLEEVSGQEAPEPLKAAAGGVPSPSYLEARFNAAAQQAIKADVTAQADDGALGQATAWFRSQVTARPTEAKEGDDVPAILSRVDAALDDGDVQTALAEADTLPDHAKEALGGWLVQLRARAEAEAALDSWLAEIGARKQG